MTRAEIAIDEHLVQALLRAQHPDLANRPHAVGRGRLGQPTVAPWRGPGCPVAVGDRDCRRAPAEGVRLSWFVDTTTPGGRLVFHLFGALAQFEREMIRDRILAGLAAACVRGRNGGRPAKLTAEQQAMARRLYDERKHTVEEIGRLLGVSRTSTYRVLGKQTSARTPAASSPTDSPAGRGRRGRALDTSS